MMSQTLDGHAGASVAIDLCLPCQSFWFDGFESLQLAPRAILQLFRFIGDQADRPRAAPKAMPACPRCGATLVPTHDMQRNTRFEYRRCPRGHGRLISFFNFLREKDFVRPLSAAQVEALRQNVQVVRCSNCGASIDLAAGSTCPHCGTALSMIDMQQAQTIVRQLQEADRPAHEIDPGLGLSLAQARRDVEAVFASFDQSPTWFSDVASDGVVGAGLTAIARWLKRAR